jgi:hypothetical protein
MFRKLVLLGALAAVGAEAGLVQIGTRTGLGANDSIDWGVLGAAFTDPTNPFVTSSVGGLGITVSQVSGVFERRDQSSGGWSGNFTPGDHLLWTNDTNGPMTFVFSTAISGVGFQIQQDNFGAFTGSIQLFAGNTSLGTFTILGNSTGNGDGSAVFLGVLDSLREITRIVVSDGETNPNFAINTMSLVTAAPEPATWGLMTLGLGLAVAISRRKIRSDRTRN